MPPTLSFGLIRAAGFNLESDFSKKSLLYNFILFNFYKDGIDRVNEYLLSCGFSPLNKKSYK